MTSDNPYSVEIRQTEWKDGEVKSWTASVFLSSCRGVSAVGVTPMDAIARLAITWSAVDSAASSDLSRREREQLENLRKFQNRVCSALNWIEGNEA